jgi:hypothetical protein
VSSSFPPNIFGLAPRGLLDFLKLSGIFFSGVKKNSPNPSLQNGGGYPLNPKKIKKKRKRTKFFHSTSHKRGAFIRYFLSRQSPFPLFYHVWSLRFNVLFLNENEKCQFDIILKTISREKPRN